MTRWFGAMTCFVAIAIPFTGAAGQGFGWIPIDHPGMPFFEQLVRQGAIDDPTPQLRPVRAADVRRVLGAARCDGKPTCESIVGRLLRTWAAPDTRNEWQAAARIGALAYNHARKDPLYPDDQHDVFQPYAEVGASLRIHGLSAGIRTIGESRVNVDPDWTGPRDAVPAFRIADAWLALETPHAALRIGSGQRNWGPVGVQGLAISNGAYSRPDIALELHNRVLHFSLIVAPLNDLVAGSGKPIDRWFAAHRLAVTPTAGLTIAVWETVVAGTTGRTALSAVDGLIGVFAFQRQFGRADDRNVILGVDASWQIGRDARIEGQLAVDDFRLLAADTSVGEFDRPDRYAFTMQANGALRSGISWLARYTRVSSLAYRTTAPAESFLYRGVGIARVFPDNDVLTLGAGVTASAHVLLEPNVSVLRQGEGRIQTAFPQDEESLASTPSFLIGTVRSTVRLGMRATAELGPVSLEADVGANRTRNPQHLAGPARNRLDGRLLITIGARRAGGFP